MNKEAIRIVLINTSHPGNIGSVARAMKTMGFKRLYLVAPKAFPHAKADEMASGAIDVLASAVVTDDFDQAVSDCALVIGTSARKRAIPWPLMTPRALAEKIEQENDQNEIALVFGREQSGLTNEELERCHWHIQIPANPEYSSLNLAAAVQIITYELHAAALAAELVDEQQWDYRLATADEMEKLFHHLQAALISVDFLKTNAPRKLMTRLRRLYMRARPDIMEINILRGMLNAFQHNVSPITSESTPPESVAEKTLHDL